MGDEFWHLLMSAKISLLNRLDLLKIEAENSYGSEAKGATDIQRVFRGTRVRIIIRFKSLAANQIERVFRGHLSRKLFNKLKDRKRNYRQRALYNYFCILLQKCFRGYYSRKYRVDHAKRKNYVKEIIQKGIEVRKMMADYATQQALMANEKSSNDAKDSSQNKTIKSKKLIVDMNGSKRIPLKGLKNKLSLQASAPFNAIEKQRQADTMLHRLLSMDPERKFFVSGGRTDIINSKHVSMNTDSPYIDPWDNPMMQRGVPADQKQMLESARTGKALFAKPPEKPFFTSSGGNKSSVLPNDIFDVIAEAQETGGVTQRHLGVTSRFGIPDNADYRPPDGTIPQPPVRASSLRLTRPKVKSFNVPMHTSLQSLQQKALHLSHRDLMLEDENNDNIDPFESSDEDN